MPTWCSRATRRNTSRRSPHRWRQKWCASASASRLGLGLRLRLRSQCRKASALHRQVGLTAALHSLTPLHVVAFLRANSPRNLSDSLVGSSLAGVSLAGVSLVGRSFASRSTVGPSLAAFLLAASSPADSPLADLQNVVNHMPRRTHWRAAIDKLSPLLRNLRSLCKRRCQPLGYLARCACVNSRMRVRE